MIKSVLRILAVFTALLLAASIPGVSGAFTMSAFAADEPEFTLECSSPDVRTGDIITVTLYVTNTTGTSVSAFDGSVTFNSSHFSYYDFSYPANMTNRMTCIDHSAASSSVVSFTFADSTKTVIPTGTTKLPLLYLRFMAVSKVSGTGQLSCEISSCYSGLTAYEAIAPMQLMVPVSNVTTASTTQSTTSSTQPKVLSSDAHLQSLTINYGTLSPTFNPEFVAYTATVDYLIATVRISATPSAGGAIVMGSGVKELGVGQNTFTITVTAEDGSTMHYGIVITRLPEESTVPVSTEPTTMTSMDSDVIVTLPSYDVPTVTDPVPSSVPPQDDKVIEGSSDMSSDNGTVKVIGIIFAEVALFMFGFLAGFFLDKNMKKKDLAELAYGPLDRSYPQQPAPVGRYPQQPVYPPEPDYSGYAPAPEDDGFGSSDNFPQYSVYDESRYDEYGNPIDSDYQDGGRTYYN